jgi:hypothetical protein
MAEPEWTKTISSNAVCTYYYILFVVNCVIAALTLVMIFGVLPFMRLPKGVLISNSITSILLLALAVVNSLFLYLLCDRALLGSAQRGA